MYKSTSNSMQHRARHPGAKTDQLRGFCQKERVRQRREAFKRILAAELRWTEVKLPTWVAIEIRRLGIRRWLDVQHRRSDDAAEAVLKNAVGKIRTKKKFGSRRR